MHRIELLYDLYFTENTHIRVSRSSPTLPKTSNYNVTRYPILNTIQNLVIYFPYFRNATLVSSPSYYMSSVLQ